MIHGPHVHNSIVFISQDMEATQVSINIWTDKEVVYMYVVYMYNSTQDKKWNSVICSKVDGPREYYA